MGFDINKTRIKELKDNFDKTKEITFEELNNASNICYSCNIDDLLNIDIFIVTVPTPVDQFKKPDLTALIKCSEMIGKILKNSKFSIKENLKLPLIIFDSTVYPGVTEEVCVPIIQKYSGFKLGVNFYCGYSPERINPGDQKHKISDIV